MSTLFYFLKRVLIRFLAVTNSFSFFSHLVHFHIPNFFFRKSITAFIKFLGIILFKMLLHGKSHPHSVDFPALSSDCFCLGLVHDHLPQAVLGFPLRVLGASVPFTGGLLCSFTGAHASVAT